MWHGCPELKLLNDFFISVQLLIKELLIKKIAYINPLSTNHESLRTAVTPGTVKIIKDFDIFV